MSLRRRCKHASFSSPFPLLISAVSAREAQYGIENWIRISNTVAARAWSAPSLESERPVIGAAIEEFEGRGVQIANGKARQPKTQTRGRPRTARRSSLEFTNSFRPSRPVQRRFPRPSNWRRTERHFLLFISEYTFLNKLSNTKPISDNRIHPAACGAAASSGNRGCLFRIRSLPCFSMRANRSFQNLRHTNGHSVVSASTDNRLLLSAQVCAADTVARLNLPSTRRVCRKTMFGVCVSCAVHTSWRFRQT